MRLWYVVSDKEYWLQPEWSEGKSGRLTVYGCKIYGEDGKFKGYWTWKEIPQVIQENIKERVRDHIKRRILEERRQAKAGIIRWLEDDEA